MKMILLLIVSAFVLNSSPVPNSTIKVEYDEIVTFIPQIVNNDKGVLYVSQNESYYNTLFDNTSSIDKIDNESIVVPASDAEYFSEIYIDRKQKTLTENLFERVVLKKHYSVNEEIPNMKWKLINEKKKINDFLCKKAQTTFRGRTYVAWYTEDIPISSGPWKFNGLPGLILSIDDNEEIYKWRVKSITYPFKGTFDLTKVKMRMKKFSKISYKDFDTKIINAQKNKFETIKARNGGRNQNIELEFSTSQWKEPINEFRKQKDFIF